MGRWTAAAQLAIHRCGEIARFSEYANRITRTYLCPPMHDVHRCIRAWCEAAGCSVVVDAVGNLRAIRAGYANQGRIVIGSHLDTVPDAGAFDGVLGVMIG